MLEKLKRIINIFIIVLLIIVGIIIYSNYSYNKEDSIIALKENALEESHNCCAWYVMKALHNGKCYVPILAAADYKYILPLYGFYKTNDENYVKGDIVVFPRIGKHKFGHIAMYDGNNWISDFKQNKFYVSKDYKNTNYIMFRHK
jgi:hypothetical protein